MEDGPRKLVKQVAAALVTLVCAASAHAQPGNAAGDVTVNGRRFDLRHVYVSVQPGFFDKSTQDLRVLLTDTPVGGSDRDVFALSRLARSGKLHGIEVVIDAKGEPMSGFLFLDAFDGMVSAAGMHRFERKTLERARIAGRLFTEGSHTFSGVTWAYDVTFSSAIARPPTAEEAAAALKSPPALAAVAHLAAVQKGFDDFLATLTSSSAPAYSGAGGAARFEQVRAQTPADSRVVSLANGSNGTRIATVQSVRADGIIIEFFLTIRQEGTTWKVER